MFDEPPVQAEPAPPKKPKPKPTRKRRARKAVKAAAPVKIKRRKRRVAKQKSLLLETHDFGEILGAYAHCESSLRKLSKKEIVAILDKFRADMA